MYIFPSDISSTTNIVTGGSGLITAIAGQSLSGGRIVYISAGKAYYFDPSDATLAGLTLGITVGAAILDADVQVQLFGVFEVSGLGLTPDKTYFVGANGTLTLSISGLTVVQQVGVSLSANKLALHFYSPIITI